MGEGERSSGQIEQIGTQLLAEVHGVRDDLHNLSKTVAVMSSKVESVEELIKGQHAQDLRIAKIEGTVKLLAGAAAGLGMLVMGWIVGQLLGLL